MNAGRNLSQKTSTTMSTTTFRSSLPNTSSNPASRSAWWVSEVDFSRYNLTYLEMCAESFDLWICSASLTTRKASQCSAPSWPSCSSLHRASSRPLWDEIRSFFHSISFQRSSYRTNLLVAITSPFETTSRPIFDKAMVIFTGGQATNKNESQFSS